MSGLETLSPDQRAVLQLILVQGRGYDELAATLRLDPAAVRERAHAGAAALVPDDLDPATRGRVVDYLLGQQDDGERIVTFAELGDAPAAARWAQALRERLAGVARDELPEVPAATPVSASVNGSGGVATVTDPAADPAVPDPATTTAAIAAIPPAPPMPPRDAPDEPSGPRPSRLGGAILIAGLVALLVVLAIVLIGGNGDDNGSPASTSTAQQAQTTAQTQTATTPTNARSQARTIGGAVLRPAAGGAALGVALVQQAANGRRLLAVEAARMPGNGAQDFYGIWLRGAAGNRFLGFVPRQVSANGTFTVSSALPRSLDLTAYSTVLVTTEGSSAVPTTPGTTVISGPLRLAG